MTYHIIHIMSSGSRLSVDKGFLVSKHQDEETNKIAIEDIRALIIGTQGISFSNECISRLLEQDSIILHCNNKYKPVGWSVSLDKVVRSEAFKNQLYQNQEFQNLLWNKIIRQKFQNQSTILDILNANNLIKSRINRVFCDEGDISKKYWQSYFSAMNCPQNREHKNAQSFENSALNYGYTVLLTLLHRSVLIHGLLPTLGIHHAITYGNTPLVYDLLESLRGFVDLSLYKFSEEDSLGYLQEDFKSWIKYFSENLKRIKIYKNEKSYKLMDAIDIYVNTITQAFIELDSEKAWLPSIKDHYVSKDSIESEE